MDPKYSEPGAITTVEELIKALAEWTPDTPVSFAPTETGEPTEIVQTNYDGHTLTFLVE